MQPVSGTPIEPHGATTKRTTTLDHAALRDGATHFALEGPANGRPIVLLHGASVPLWEFDLLVPHLTAAGFRTLRFDLFGHGWSDRPRLDYTLDLFVRQVVELVETLRFARPTAILGHSVGAAIAAALAAQRPEWIERLILVAPMLNFNATTPWSLALRWPGVGEALMQRLALPALVRRRRRRYARIGQPHLTERFVEQASRDGFWQALLSMIRSETLGDQRARYAALSGFRRDVLVISGNRDRVLPKSHLDGVRRLLPAHRHVEIPGAGDNLLLTHPREVAAALRTGR